jgi:hypothetical protein
VEEEVALSLEIEFPLWKVYGKRHKQYFPMMELSLH